MAIVVVTGPNGTGRPQEEHSETNPDAILDSFDSYNHPRERRGRIACAILAKYQDDATFFSPSQHETSLVETYRSVQDVALLEFLTMAWSEWVSLGTKGRDPESISNGFVPGVIEDEQLAAVPPMVMSHSPLHRDLHQLPSRNVMGAMSYYCTDRETPIVSTLVTELLWDAAVVKTAVEHARGASELGCKNVSYALTTHPGHHAARESFGGYCYVNQAAMAARHFQTLLPCSESGEPAKVAILDIDYHCGNGTASIFYEDGTVYVLSIHCDPNFDYPFHSGFSSQQGVGSGLGTTHHMPLPPGTTWSDNYRPALEEAMTCLLRFGAQAIVISLGLDTHDGDEVTMRRAGFRLSGKDYYEMGSLMGRSIPDDIPTVFIQEGGYKMDKVGEAAADVVVGFAHGRRSRKSEVG